MLFMLQLLLPAAAAACCLLLLLLLLLPDTAVTAAAAASYCCYSYSCFFMLLPTLLLFLRLMCCVATDYCPTHSYNLVIVGIMSHVLCCLLCCAVSCAVLSHVLCCLMCCAASCAVPSHVLSCSYFSLLLVQPHLMYLIPPPRTLVTFPAFASQKWYMRPVGVVVGLLLYCASCTVLQASAQYRRYEEAQAVGRQLTLLKRAAGQLSVLEEVTSVSHCQGS